MFFFYPPGCFDGLAARGTLRSQELATCTFLQQKSFQLKRFWAEPLGSKVEGHMHASGPILFRKVVSVLNKRNLGTHLLYVCYVYIHTLHAFEMARPPRRPRLPHGQGRRAEQKIRRNAIATEVANKLVRTLDLETIEETGSLFPRVCDLRKLKHRRTFAFLSKYAGRVFTRRLCLLVTRKLMKLLPFTLAQDPRAEDAEELKHANRLARLAKKAKRMDTEETQPLVALTPVF